MKTIERLAYMAFWINIFIVIFIYIGMPILFINVPDFFESWIANKGRNPLNITFSILSLFVIFLWGYCIWFLFKYDRYSKSIFLLFFLSILYAPIYYYRVKIKKRPLRNMIKKTQDLEKEVKSISEEEFVDFNRNNVFGVIDLWTSKETQLDYQRNVPIENMSAELFSQWQDFYLPDSNDFKQSFNKREFELLLEFDIALNDTIDKTPQNLPVIEEFIKTEEWKIMNGKAIEIRKKINTVGNK